MSRFAHLDKRKAAAPEPQLAPEPASKPLASRTQAAAEEAAPAAARVPAARAKAREGKKPVIGYFSPDLSREIAILAATEGKTMQALLGEALDLLMTDRGRNRFNER
jgi:hypothetical protein